MESKPPNVLLGHCGCKFPKVKGDAGCFFYSSAHLHGSLDGGTHSARSGVGHPPLEGHPLVVGSVSVGVGSQEDPADVCHVVHTHRRTLKDVAAKGRRRKKKGQEVSEAPGVFAGGDVRKE